MSAEPKPVGSFTSFDPQAALASLLPWAAFLVATALADRWVDHTSGSFAGLVASAPWYLGFVAAPAYLPLAAARHRLVRIAVLVVMTATAGTAGVLVVASDDAQAGLAVLVVSYVALPLAGAIEVVNYLRRRP